MQYIHRKSGCTVQITTAPGAGEWFERENVGSEKKLAPAWRLLCSFPEIMTSFCPRCDISSAVLRHVFSCFFIIFLTKFDEKKLGPYAPGEAYITACMMHIWMNEWMNESLFAIDNNTRKKSMSRNNSPGRTVGLRLNTALNTALIKTNKIRYARQMQYRYTTTCSNVEINSIKLCEWQFKRFIFVKYDIYGCDKLELLG